ncbi:MAG TPA: GNAT family N-acetyltransferase [Thermoanaerobaculia bacterium]|nr:GNAT family N-acetyltransferase [Thermoanaerobaculia bacterium]
MQIITQRLILRDFNAEDLPAFLETHSDPRSDEFYGPGETGPDFLRDLFEKFLRWAAEAPRRNYQLAIAGREDPRELMGSCGVRLEGCEAGMAAFGLEISPQHWGRGLASEAAGAILDFGFRDLGLREVRGDTITENVRVQRLVERLGFTRTGTRPGPGWLRARGWSQTDWRLTREAWTAAPDPG